jgi:addiction module HigA family antidote
MVPVHPGEILADEMAVRNLSGNALGLALRVPAGRILDICAGKRGITADTAIRLGAYFGNSPEFWLGLQTAYDLAVLEREAGEKIRGEVARGAA